MSFCHFKAIWVTSYLLHYHWLSFAIICYHFYYHLFLMSYWLLWYGLITLKKNKEKAEIVYNVLRAQSLVAQTYQIDKRDCKCVIFIRKRMNFKLLALSPYFFLFLCTFCLWSLITMARLSMLDGTVFFPLYFLSLHLGHV